MRSGQRIVSDEEEQVIGVPTAQVTSNMPVLGPSADSTSLRGLLIAIFILLSLPRCRCTDLGQCTTALGMESGEIPDEDISASSMYDPSLGPKHARVVAAERGVDGNGNGRRGLRSTPTNYLQFRVNSSCLRQHNTCIRTPGSGS
ncbi:hypothetical protein G5I_04908 [Acromyrmex echinatior]|uniref:Uncharacterized protein n=1 Tax=Acromyrmex echinatior TaxID=103372 RepID=F4WGV7_ACREC|nr:hypothetical protein G5I_04908 [Acromyrmex echinatior]